MTDPITRAFSNLDRWRHFPDYQLERRADVFFSVYLKDVVERFLGAALDPTVVPELPISRALLGETRAKNKSKKVDYALFSADRSRAFFVELKTDASSRRVVQDAYLARCRELGFAPIAGAIKDLLAATAPVYRKKYLHLVHQLAALGFLELPPDLEERIWANDPRATASIAEIRATARSTSVEIVYLQPHATDADRCITFEMFAAHLDALDDPLSIAFRTHLRGWTEAAGERRPSLPR